MVNHQQLEQYVYSSPLGQILLCGRASELHGLWFVGQKHFPQYLELLEQAASESLFVVKTIQWLEAYFAHRPLPELPRICFSDTVFREAVWTELTALTYGERVSYAEMAQRVSERLGTSTVAIRAVASAIGRNPISILIPCHRVLGSDGSLRGYAGGLERKQWLLDWEQSF